MAAPISSLFKARFPADKDVVLVNDFRLRKGRVSKKTGRRGKKRMTVEFRSEVVACDYSAANLGRLPAQKLQEMIKGDFAKITKQASPATVAHRKVAARAWDKGKRWAKQGYRKGTKARAEMRPNPHSTTWGVDSGLLASSIRAAFVQSNGTWTINVAGNRLLPDAFRNAAAHTAFLTELRKQVPSLNPRALAGRREWKTALQDATDSAIINLSARRKDLRARKLRTQIGIVRNILSVVA